MASTMEPTVAPTAQKKEEEAKSAMAAEDEDTGAQVAPIVKLQEVSITTSKENEDVLLDLKAKLHRFDKEGNQWKERGMGTVKLLRNKETGKVRLVISQSKTLKICANHLVLPSITLHEHDGSDKQCVWHATDFADGELEEKTLPFGFLLWRIAKLSKTRLQRLLNLKRRKLERVRKPAQLLTLSSS